MLRIQLLPSPTSQRSYLARGGTDANASLEAKLLSQYCLLIWSFSHYTLRLYPLWSLVKFQRHDEFQIGWGNRFASERAWPACWQSLLGIAWTIWRQEAPEGGVWMELVIFLFLFLPWPLKGKPRAIYMGRPKRIRQLCVALSIFSFLPSPHPAFTFFNCDSRAGLQLRSPSLSLSSLFFLSMRMCACVHVEGHLQWRPAPLVRLVSDILNRFLASNVERVVALHEHM